MSDKQREEFRNLEAIRVADMSFEMKKARWQKMIKQKDLAKKVNIATGYLCEIESGKKKIISMELLHKLEKVLLKP